MNEQEKKILFFVLQNENQEVSQKKNNRIPNLIFENKTNILFLKIKGGIKDFEFEEIEIEDTSYIYDISDKIISYDIDKKINKLEIANLNPTKEEILENIGKIMDGIKLGETYEYQNNNFTSPYNTK